MSSIWNRGLKFSIFGESHGKLIGVSIDNLPPGIKLNLNLIRNFISRRSTSNFKFGVSSRNETDKFKIISGFFNGKTSGSPLCVLFKNKKYDSSNYDKFKNFIRPGHADLTAKIRYSGFNDYRGAGHLSGRLTLPLTFVGAVCEQILKLNNIQIFTHIYSIGHITDLSLLNRKINYLNLKKLKNRKIAVLNENIISSIQNLIINLSKQGDSIGGTIECGIFGIKPGIGSPIFDKIESYIADLIFAIPAVKALEFGSGFKSSKLTGSENNDSFFINKNGLIKTKTNNHGGLLGGISSSMPIIFKVAFKPTPTIFKFQKTIDLKHLVEKEVKFSGQHDSCIVFRGVAVVEAVANIAIVSQILNQGRLKVGGLIN